MFSLNIHNLEGTLFLRNDPGSPLQAASFNKSLKWKTHPRNFLKLHATLLFGTLFWVAKSLWVRFHLA
jgi:hypothetical protein